MKRILELLRRGRGGWMSMEALSTSLGVLPEEVHRRIEQLRTIGYSILSEPARGYRLAGAVQKLAAELIEFDLETQYVGRKVLVYDETDSTNDVAWHYAKEGGYEGLAVFAEYQRVGRGRLGRQWLSPRGSSVLCSILLRDGGVVNGASLSLIAAVATAEAVEQQMGLGTRIKWPNDVCIDGRKVAGTIIESRQIDGQNWYVMGIGINCRQKYEDFSEEFQKQAISLEQISGEAVDRSALAGRLLECVDRWWIALQQRKDQELHDGWLARCDNVGRRIELVQDGRQYSGRVIDVLVNQGLLVQLDRGGIMVFDGATSSLAPVRQKP